MKKIRRLLHIVLLSVLVMALVACAPTTEVAEDASFEESDHEDDDHDHEDDDHDHEDDDHDHEDDDHDHEDDDHDHEDDDHDHDHEADGDALRLPEVSAVELAEGERLAVVATTNIIGDVVSNVGDDLIDLTVIMAPGEDPHIYEPSPQDIVAMEEADVVFYNGLGFEEGFEESLENIEEAGIPIVPVSANVDFIDFEFEGEHDHEEGEHDEDDHNEEEGEHDDHDHGGDDPHTWTNPDGVVVWTRNVESILSAMDSANSEAYAEAASAYIEALEDLENYIITQVDALPEESRVLITDHDSMGYFAAAFDFEVVGTVLPSVSTSSEASAEDLAELIEVLEDEQVPAIFVGTTVSDKTAQILAEEVGFEVAVLDIYTGSVGPAGSGAETYIDMMRANTDTIVAGLSGE